MEWLKAPFRPLKLDDMGKGVVAEEVARTQVFRAGIYCTVPRNGSQCTYTNSSDCSGDGLCVQRDVSYDRHDIFGDGNPYSPKVIGLCKIVILSRFVAVRPANPKSITISEHYHLPHHHSTPAAERAGAGDLLAQRGGGVDRSEAL